MVEAFIVDEEVLFSELLCEILSDINIPSVQIWDATNALIRFSKGVPDDAIFFIDVGLDIGRNISDFNKIETSASNTTGLRLVELIIQRRLLSRAQLNRLSLYSSHITGPTWGKVITFAKENKIKAFKKNPLFKSTDYHRIARGLMQK